MTGFAQGQAVTDLVPKFWIVAPTLGVVGAKVMTSFVTAFPAGEVVSFKDGPPPVLVSAVLSQESGERRYAALP